MYFAESFTDCPFHSFWSVSRKVGKGQRHFLCCLSSTCTITIFALRCSNIHSKWKRMFTLSLSGSCCPPLPLPLAEVTHTNASRGGHKPPKTPATKLLWVPPAACTTWPLVFDQSQKKFHQGNLHLFKSILTRLCRYFTAWSAAVQVRRFYSTPSNWIPAACPIQQMLLPFPGLRFIWSSFYAKAHKNNINTFI